MCSCIKRMTSKWFVSCCWLRPEYFNFGDEDGACRSSWRVCERYRRYCKLYRKRGGLQSCYVSSVYRSRCICRAAKFVRPWRSNIYFFCAIVWKLTERFGNPGLISKSLINKFLEISADQDENNLTTRATYIVRTFMEQALDQQLICSRLLQSYLQKLQ